MENEVDDETTNGSAPGSGSGGEFGRAAGRGGEVASPGRRAALLATFFAGLALSYVVTMPIGLACACVLLFGRRPRWAQALGALLLALQATVLVVYWDLELNVRRMQAASCLVASWFAAAAPAGLGVT
ncbi:MAG: hypothetical protein Kow0069_31560 [Promethearchaeota archaeon]